MLRRKKGFTLLELVLVIAVIAILAAIIAPRFTSQIPKAKVTSSRAQLENLRTALEMYRAEDPNGLYPTNLYYLTRHPTTGKSYMRTVPVEPLSGSANQSTSMGSGGWYYVSQTGDIRVNLTEYPDPNDPSRKIYPFYDRWEN